MLRMPFRGGRILKTGIAVFLTAWICDLLGWPPVFAVITAIVTIEPTVTDSIKKGIIRFPASAIGSFYTVTFVSIFGHAPITYTLSTVFTIATCYQLNLHAGLLVATLTAVAMIDVVHSHFLIAFFTRLGTTTIGLLVSTAVNLFILPPEYSKEIHLQIQQIRKKVGALIDAVFQQVTQPEYALYDNERQMMKQIQKKIAHATTLLQFEEKDTLHPIYENEKPLIAQQKQQLKSLQMIVHHLENVINMPITELHWDEGEKKMILQFAHSLSERIEHTTAFQHSEHEQQMNELTQQFFNEKEKQASLQPTFMPPKTIIFYELLTIYILGVRPPTR